MRVLGATQPNSVWSYDFAHDRLATQRTIRLLCVLDEHTRKCLAIEVARSPTSRDVILTLTRLMRLYGKPQMAVCTTSSLTGGDGRLLRIELEQPAARESRHD